VAIGYSSNIILHKYVRLSEISRAVQEEFYGEYRLIASTPPQTSAGLPAGKPSLVITFSPRIPVETLGQPKRDALAGFWFYSSSLLRKQFSVFSFQFLVGNLDHQLKTKN
jgi:hypothetical protein